MGSVKGGAGEVAFDFLSQSFAVGFARDMDVDGIVVIGGAVVIIVGGIAVHHGG